MPFEYGITIRANYFYAIKATKTAYFCIAFIMGHSLKRLFNSIYIMKDDFFSKVVVIVS